MNDLRGLSSPRGGKRSDKIPYKRTPRSSHSDGDAPQRGRPRKWKKGHDDDDDELHEKRKKKKKHHLKDDMPPRHKESSSRDSVNDPEEEMTLVMDDLPPEKSLQCQVSLAEINRRLGVVMCQPFG